MDYNCWISAVLTLKINSDNFAEQLLSKLTTISCKRGKSWNLEKLYWRKEETPMEGISVWRDSYVGETLICFESIAYYFALIQIFGDICTFSPLLRVMSHPEQNPCITKQLDQKAPVMQQGSNAPYLLLRWEMEGKEGVWKGGAEGSEKAVEEGGVQEQEYDSQINTATLQI